MYAVYDEQTPANNVLLTTARTLFDAEGRAIVTVGPYATGDTPVGTETVYDALGRVVETRRWANVEIQASIFAVDPENGEILVPDETHPAVGIHATGWTKGDRLSRTCSDYDVAGRVYRSYAPTQSTTEKGVCTQEIHYDAAGRQVEVISLPDEAAKAAMTVTHYDGPRQDWTRDACNNVTSFEYDALGRMIRTIHPATAYIPKFLGFHVLIVGGNGG